MAEQQQQQQQQTGAQDNPTAESVNIELNPNRPQDLSQRMSYLSNAIMQRPIKYDPILILFVLFILATGIIGYVSAGSTASLVAGVIFAILLAFATYFEGARKNPYPLLVVSIVLAGVMIYRFTKSLDPEDPFAKFWPAGVIGLVTLIVFARHLFILYLKRQRPSEA